MLDSLANHYLLISKIGEGSFSEVLKVKSRETGEFFAAKRLTNPFTSLEEVEEYTELRTLKKLEFHPNVLHLVEYVYEPNPGTLSLIFNLMDMSLYDFIKDRKRKLPESRCKNYIYQLLNGINYLHQNGIFHR
jgi:renal tumor antigen